ncbi:MULTISPECIES: NAD(P)-dependent alcohol dehydrogenase [unclassified Pseudomonas]|uniref:NAD(P)-dependent alcohol dehydrogenase n=1 Tax=unclassified Pseudomonas TaxID=196821 RepID=UPI000CD2DAF6|nr:MULTISPECIES: NAD(P)-dependent alcohol dehydrogenase [unclassified Pseudomonas]POA52551.1 alcohol dehydrogenase [Pseudomonas sp. FW507-12TSA]
MKRTVSTWAAYRPGDSLKSFDYQADEPGPLQVEIRITHCGVCTSDLHLIEGNWGEASQYPQVCGHEVVGQVARLGCGVSGLALGQRVGVGWYKGACLACEWCRKGEEQHCPSVVATCANGQHGGFADYLTCDSRFVFPIPQQLPSEVAAPLLCAGQTVYTALLRGVHPGMRVGVLGIGGLGHLAIQFASQFGCSVTALSSSAHKRADALAMGATRFVGSDRQSLLANANSLDFLLVTASNDQDWASALEMLRPRGTLCFAGMPNPVTLDISSMTYKTLAVTTANVGGRQEMLDMLAFAEQHRIWPQVRLFPAQRINDALEAMRSNDVRYRAVIEFARDH